MATKDEVRGWLEAWAEGEDAEALGSVEALLSSASGREQLEEAGAIAGPALVAILEGGSLKRRAQAAELLGALGDEASAAGAAEALALAAQHTDRSLRSAALDAMMAVPAEVEVYGEAIGEALRRGDAAAMPLVAIFGAASLPWVLEAIRGRSLKARKTGVQALVEIASEIDGTELEGTLQVLLEDWDREALQRGALEVVARLRRVPQGLAEPVADLTSMPGSRRALLRFDKAKVKRELPSLITSQNEAERLVGLGIAQSYGQSAAEFAAKIASELGSDTRVSTTLASLRALSRLIDDEETLAASVEPALDHWSEEVRAAATELLEATGAPVRTGVWQGHPFSDALAQQLQRYGFTPRGDTMQVPEERPFPDLGFAWEPASELELPEALSPAIWALMEMLDRPPYELYTAWDQQESIHFYVERYGQEGTLLPVTLGDGVHAMYPFGDGSIGFYVCYDLLDTSDDPSVYFVERWGDAGWLAARRLSSFLRTGMGSRRGK